VSEETKRRFYELRGEVNSYLDAGSGVKIYYKEDGKIVDSIAFGDDGEGDSRREILDLFRFGYYEHMNGEKKPKQLASIKKLMPSAYVLIEQIDLIKILRGLIEYFLEIKKINEDAISELEDNI
ncbi:MAG TPA: hypothetical protein V6C57_29230, partial [Coleofasciculaceae cyanobacterium]